MTPEQITLIEASWAEIRPIVPEVPALFYARLFEIAPELRGMFPEDMAEQGQKLMAMLSAVVAGLRAPERLMPAVRELGERHAGYGVAPEHYAPVGAALIWTLDQGLDGGLDAPTREAWTAAYTILSAAMIDAAQSTTTEAAE